MAPAGHQPLSARFILKKYRFDAQKNEGNRGYYLAARRYEISLRVLKNISRVIAANTNETPMKYQTTLLK